jgi:hypothetical protein
MYDECGSIEPEDGEVGVIPGLCPVSLVILRCSGPEWIICWHHRHGTSIDPIPFGLVRQTFN